MSPTPVRFTTALSRAKPRTHVLPAWDPDRRELRLGGKLVKRFRVPAAAQEAILAAFQESGWPPRTDDPLPRNGGRLDPKDRLRDTVRALNRHQREARIRFRCDGTGEGILWEVVSRPPTDLPRRISGSRGTILPAVRSGPRRRRDGVEWWGASGRPTVG